MKAKPTRRPPQAGGGRKHARRGIPKAATGIAGLDEITLGGLPQGRATLVCGGTGSGKTLLGVEFLARGAQQFGEPGVMFSFEESAQDISDNVSSLGFDLPALEDAGLLLVDQVATGGAGLTEAGEYDLDGLFIRLGLAIETVGARRVVLDTIEAAFGIFSNEATLRAEIRRLFSWLGERGVTTIVTGERGAGALTRHGMEEYASDCIILLDQRVERQATTRRLRVVKYRGSSHGADEYPFIITGHGFSVLPASSPMARDGGTRKRLSTGMPRLDTMLGGKGLYRGSSTLVSASAGAGKTSLAATVADAACRRGEHTLFLAYEESPGEIVRNMSSIGLDLAQWIDAGVLSLQAERTTTLGFETHLARLHAAVGETHPKVVIVDPISAFHGPEDETKALLARIVDFLKSRAVTTLLTSLTRPDGAEPPGLGVSSIVDTWIAVRTVESNGENNRLLSIVKSRGMGHSNQARELLISDDGLDLLDVYSGLEGMAVGSARIEREGVHTARALKRKQTLERRQRALDQRRAAADAQIAVLQADLALESASVDAEARAQSAQESGDAVTRSAIAGNRGTDRTPRAGRRRGGTNGQSG